MMENGVKMATIFGDGRNQKKGFMGKLCCEGQRMVKGESLVVTTVANEGG